MLKRLFRRSGSKGKNGGYIGGKKVRGFSEHKVMGGRDSGFVGSGNYVNDTVNTNNTNNTNGNNNSNSNNARQVRLSNTDKVSPPPVSSSSSYYYPQQQQSTSNNNPSLQFTPSNLSPNLSLTPTPTRSPPPS